MTVSVIIPTRNRANRWTAGPLLADLRDQTSKPDEVIIAVDHTEDHTVEVLQLARRSAPYPLRILNVHVPRPDPPGASAIPDNCALKAATGSVIIHLDDDLEIQPGLVTAVRAAFDGGPACTIWPQTNFVDVDPAVRPDPVDVRARHAVKRAWPRYPGGFVELPKYERMHWGAAWCLPSSLIRKAGGHNIAQLGYHNSDTRLGMRLAKLAPSYLATGSAWQVLHHGHTWYGEYYAKHGKPDASRHLHQGPPIANGGKDFWTSSWFDGAYTELDT